MMEFQLLRSFVAVAECRGLPSRGRATQLDAVDGEPADQAARARDRAPLVPAHDTQRRADG